MSRGWLIVFAKAPRPGLVKTRFSPPLSPDQCVELYEAMLGDVLEASASFAHRFDLDPVLAVHPPDALAEMAQRAPQGFRVHAQRGQGLAERMANAFAESAAAGMTPTLLRGSDSPALSEAHVAESLERLESGADVVFTPDLGGGYAMIGQRRPLREIFDVPMSTGDMLDQSIALGSRLGLRCECTAPTFDLDTLGDLSRIEGLSEQEMLKLCSRTEQAVLQLRSVGVL